MGFPILAAGATGVVLLICLPVAVSRAIALAVAGSNRLWISRWILDDLGSSERAAKR
jgi:hypothetical protein